jgi:DNA primase
MNCSQANNIPIQEVFESVSNTPKGKENNNEVWYISPFNPDQETPSFKINLSLNTWYDFNIGKGGKVLDLIIELKRCSVKEALIYLSEIRSSFNSTLFSFPQQAENLFHSRSNFYYRTDRYDRSMQESTFEITKIRELKNPVLIDYIKSRKINIDLARKFLSEIYFFNNKTQKNYFACAWENKNNGWEWANKYGKGVIGNKYLSHIQINNNLTKLDVYEGFFDFLSHYTLIKEKTLKNDSIILNSVTQVKQAKQIIKNSNYSKIFLYLDNDKAGNNATNELMNLEIDVLDKRSLFTDFKDMNDLLLNNHK